VRQIPFVKAHALGNDFLLIEEPHMAGISPGELALRMCERHTGVGADGIVVLGSSASADASFRIYNSDGSEAALSGNALRCAAAWVAVRAAEPPARIRFDARVGLRELYFLGRAGNRWTFRTEVGRPRFTAGDVPFHPPRSASEPILDFPLPVGGVTVPVTVLNMGNPQCLVFVEDWEAVDWQVLGAAIERHAYFPDRTNVGFVRCVSEERIEARFWERGAGHTLASGTGSCACVVAAHLAGKTLRRVTVGVERGEAEVTWREDAMVELVGPAEIVAEGKCFY
jgi:diaminopimelate epimerase